MTDDDLLFLINQGRAPDVIRALDADPSKAHAKARGTTALGLACGSVGRFPEMFDVVVALLARGAPVNEPDQHGATPLAEATRVRNLPLVEHLLAAGADPSAAGAEGSAPLVSAADSFPLLDCLLRAGADPNRGGIRGQTPLQRALEDACFERLIAAGAVYTLRAAVARGDIGRVEALVRANPDAVLGDPDPVDLDSLACLNGGRHDRGRKVARRIRQILDSVRPPPSPFAAAIQAMDRDEQTQLKTLLRAHPELATARGAGGRSLLHFAISAQVFQVQPFLSLLVAAGAPIDATDDTGCTALALAASANAARPIPFLLSAGADPYRKDASGRSPVVKAALASRCADEALGPFLKHGVEVDVTLAAILCDATKSRAAQAESALASDVAPNTLRKWAKETTELRVASAWWSGDPPAIAAAEAEGRAVLALIPV